MSVEGIKVSIRHHNNGTFILHQILFNSALKKVNTFVNYQIHRGELNSHKVTYDPFSHVFAQKHFRKDIFNFKTCTVFLSVFCEWILQHGARTHTEPVQFEENN